MHDNDGTEWGKSTQDRAKPMGEYNAKDWAWFALGFTLPAAVVLYVLSR